MTHGGDGNDGTAACARACIVDGCDQAASGANITTVDLYTPVLEKCGGPGYTTCPGFQLPNNVHYTDEGWAFLAQTMRDHLATLF
jgi:hypothetical protein